ncbi:putative toxin-antitoxin system toxin component, PIN family [Oscillatoria sp. CS-180]|uniref:putative toxin-antitoxin system toxin component, PIN family n=1 Tax=Oscillatoria sp. CS-180 TaxID=3021720 RepID=UPI003FA6ADC3
MKLVECSINKKLKNKIDNLQTTPDALIGIVRSLSRFYVCAELEVPNPRDSNDSIILSTALSSNTDAIVTGDHDLLTLVEFCGIPILRPQDF